MVPAGGCLAGLLSLHGFFHGNFSRKKAPENFGPFLAVVFRRCCFHRRGEFAAGGPALGRLPRRSAFCHGERAEYRPHLPRKFPANFAARYFMRAVKGLFPGILTPPYSPPTSGKNSLEILEATAPRKFPLSPFLPKTARKFWLKIIPQSPLKGDVGNGFGGIDGAKIRRYDARQAQAKRPRPSEPAQAVQEGGRA